MVSIDTTGTPVTPCMTTLTLTLAPGWWMLLSVLGGLYLWYCLIAACFG